ncbi:8802_t:CDS:10 [Paraglomus occultum]|uniref:8802_t:CDS:1 n=1 Tax=Paraglomus occultum TaxID=144539 RepID=A0A9N9F0B9_9GLOM|nr:8802_t:CDS:10 [Paraglomus occultum]
MEHHNTEHAASSSGQSTSPPSKLSRRKTYDTSDLSLSGDEHDRHKRSAAEIYLYPGNVLWAIAFGWWLALISYFVSICLYFTPFGGQQYARVLRELSYYIFWPFGKYVERVEDEWYNVFDDGASEDHEYNSRMSYEDGERERLLGNNLEYEEAGRSRRKRTGCCGKLCDLGLAGLVFYFWFFLLIGPLYMLVSCLCWFMVISIPMAKLTFVLTRHLRKHPLSLHFKSGSSLTLTLSQHSVILLCTYKAIGLQYYKYTYDGINIIFINLMPIVLFTFIDHYVFVEWLGKEGFLFSATFRFSLCLASVIPLSYFIGMAVASISAQSSIGLGAVINATFGSIIEIILYAIALVNGKGLLVEGSLIGSLMAGVLFMPGISMVSGGLKRKEQRFNAKSAEVTSTMLIMAIIGALTPTLFYQTYGQFEMRCEKCPTTEGLIGTCERCYQLPIDPWDDPFYDERVKPLMYFCAFILVLSYSIGLCFSLGTHASLVWHSYHAHESEPSSARGSLYKRLIPLHMLQQILPGSTHYTHGSGLHQDIPPPNPRPQSAPTSAVNYDTYNMAQPEEEEEPGGHDSPNWSKFKSGVVLVLCTVAYSFIAEILVANLGDVFEEDADIKFLGLTLFALVPNITEFMNAMSFAIYGNIALSMEIGSAYALQVCMLQIPAMVAFSAWYTHGSKESMMNSFTLVFPRWDVFAVVFSVFLLTYTYIEGKSNYFKGSILILSYLVLLAGFYFA